MSSSLCRELASEALAARASLGRARVVAVLDAWARDCPELDGSRTVALEFREADHQWICRMYDGDYMSARAGKTPDAARAAAAAAIEKGSV